ncbi:MAG: hypothetical protein U9P71_03905 [Campylobacterota bacterium]|nr:hypothetical protein [Campylobacterota bacterium]
MEKVEKKSKHWLMIAVNFVLALISVYLFEFWYKQVIGLQTLQLVENIAVVVLTALTYFIGKTYYIKGVMNTAKKIIILILLSLAILGLMLLSVKVPSDMVYPFSGVLIVSVAFYMLSLTAGTLNTIGIIGLSLLFTAAIAFLKWFNVVDWNMAGELGQLAIFIILFIGGTWAEIRALIHGIRGTNADGGFGDGNDGDGDTGSE